MNVFVFFFCSLEYLKLTNEKGQSLGVYCGRKTVKTVEVIGDYAVIIFHSLSHYQFRGFRISFRFNASGSDPTTIGTVTF